jgi:hypothetical protein
MVDDNVNRQAWRGRLQVTKDSTPSHDILRAATVSLGVRTCLRADARPAGGAMVLSRGISGLIVHRTERWSPQTGFWCATRQFFFLRCCSRYCRPEQTQI